MHFISSITSIGPRVSKIMESWTESRNWPKKTESIGKMPYHGIDRHLTTILFSGGGIFILEEHFGGDH